MTVPAQRLRRVSKRTGVVLRVLLAVALLAPVGVLFNSAWQANDERRSYADRERHGIEYLRSLGPVTVALVDAASSAVAGRSGAREALRSAVEGTSALDVRYGAELRTSERWAGIRAKLEALPDRPADPQAASTAYGEATDLLLALYAKVRESSGLVRDPGPDSYHLQDAAAEELPEALIAAGRLADLTVITARRPASERLRTAGELALARAAVVDPATDLVNDLRAAVDNTESRTLGGNLLRRLDGYQRAVELLAGLTADPRAPADPLQVGTARSAAHLSGAELSTIILSELDILVQVRADEATDQRSIALGALTLAVLMLVALATGTVLAGRATRPGARRGDDTRGVPPGGVRSGMAPGAGAPPAGPPLAAPPLSVGSPLAGTSLAGAPPLPERRPLRSDPAGEPGRRSPLPDWPDPVPAGQANSTMPGTPDTEPTPWGRPDAAR